MELYQVNFRIAGDKSQLPSELISFLKEKEQKFRFPSSPKTLVLAINYGGQDEIIMLWRIAYAQLYFTDLYCPEFTIDEFKKALKRYDQSIETQNF